MNFPVKSETSFLEGGDVCILLIMVCSRCPKEYRHYETILKRKCLRKLRYNVWEKKTKWVLLEKAEHHYRTKLLRRHINLWVAYLNRCYKKKINRRAADALYEEKLKSRGISVLRRNVEHNWMIMRICRRKFEWNLKYKCWHQWKHYAEKRSKVREVKLLADRIREERLRIWFFYLWLFRFNEKRSLEKACEAAAARNETKLKEKYFKAWKIFTTKQIWKVRIESLAVACYEDKLKERLIRCWKRHTFQKKRYRYQMTIIENFYQNYLLKNYLSRWLAAYRELKLERKICNLNLAINFYERRLLRRGFDMILRVREAKRRKDEKVAEFREIYVKIHLDHYLNLWVEKRTAKIVWNHLEERATKWREDFLRETYFLNLVDKYQKIVEEREEMASVIKYSNAIITHKAFRGWRQVTKRKIQRKAELENASKWYFEQLLKTAFQKWRKFMERKSRKKMAAGYYTFNLLSKALNQWSVYHNERKIKLAEAVNLEQKYNKKLLKTAFDYWKNETDDSKSKAKSAVDFYRNSSLAKTFHNWKEITRIKTADKNRYNRNKAILDGILLKNTLTLWCDMLWVKRTLKRRLQEFKLKQERRCLKSHFGVWRKFGNKMKTLRQNAEVYPQVRSDILLEQYLHVLVDAVKCKVILNANITLAVEAEERMLKRRYLRRWLRFVCWKRERILSCLSENTKCGSREDLQVFVAAGNSTRRKPMIPGYMKTDAKYLQFEDRIHNEERKIRHRRIQTNEI